MEARDLWAAIDGYVSGHLINEDPALDAVLAASDRAGLVGGPISAGQGRMLELLVRISGSRRVLEIGTLGGYSTIWLARGLPQDGHVVTLEVDAHHAEVARANIASVSDWPTGSTSSWGPPFRAWRSSSPSAVSRST
jgi:predicted O-methyltransferase YrrM